MNLLDSLFGAFVLAAIVACLATLTGNLTRSQEADAASRQIEILAKASQQWVQEHRTELITDENFTKTTGRKLELDELKSAGLLNQGFPAQSIWGQPFAVYLRRASDDADSISYASIQIITAAVGVPSRNGWNGSEGSRIDFIREKTLETALRTKGGGYVPAERMRNLYGITETTLYGPKTEWTLDLAAEHGIDDIGEGSYAVVSSFAASDAGLKPDYIYRAAVDGHPELNRMETALDMNGHVLGGAAALQLTPIGEGKFYYNGSLRDADNIGALCGESGAEGLVFLDSDKGLYACRGGRLVLMHDTGNSVQVSKIEVVANGAVIDKPSCSAGLEAQIWAAPVSTAEGGTPTAITGFNTWTENASSTQWRVRHSLTTEGNSTAHEPSGSQVRIMAVTGCVDPHQSY